MGKARASSAAPLRYDLVVVGSSAGGIEALSTLVSTLPKDFSAPLVIAQHLDPEHASHLGEILARQTKLTVRTITDGPSQPLVPGTIYVAPSNRNVEITDHSVGLRDETPSEPPRRPKPSVDRLLGSAAGIFGDRLIAVILTGTGSDGAEGAREVKQSGGVVIIENPDTAAYSAMPSALAPSTVDIVADLGQIGPLLGQLVAGAYTLDPMDDAAILDAFLAQVRAHSGIDFSTYKQATIHRRLQRRLAATGMSRLSDYIQYLSQHPEEYARLVASFLIKVTEFFRDANLFAALRDQVAPDLIAEARAAHRTEIRIWSAGCATGEEAYSLAILMAEALGDELDSFTVRIFATDLDAEAVAYARRGVYPAAALAGLTPELIARYFTRMDGAYMVNERVRSLIIFGQHDLGQRAPFPHMDLVLCRNVLIYFTATLQKRALQLFAFALRDGGYLALGSSETISQLATYFTPAHGGLKLYRRQGPRVVAPATWNRDSRADGTLPLPIHLPPLPSASSVNLVETRANRDSVNDQQRTGPRLQTSGEKLGNILLDLPVGVVVVDRHYDIQTINSAAHQLLGIYQPAIGEDLIHLAQSVPTTPLRAAIDAAFRVAPAAQSLVSVAQADLAVNDEHEVATEPVELSLAPSRTAIDGTAPHGGGASETTLAVETTLGESRALQIVCYPYYGSGLRAGGAAARPDAAIDGASVPQAVLILVTDVTETARLHQAAEEVATREQHARQERASREQRGRQQMHAREQEERTAERARDQVELERLRARLRDVAETNRDLLAANQQFTTANLRLRNAQEELLISTEEVQAGSEEIKTLNEELQATNEELETLNEELEATVEELHTTNDDLQARGRELQSLAETLETQRQISEGERSRFEAILLSMGDALMVVDGEGATVLTNASYARMFGSATAVFQAEDEQGQPLPDEESPRQRMKAGAAFTMQFTLAAEDGSRRWFEASGQPIRSTPETRSGVITIRDITDRSVQRLQEEFTMLASHELRSPLTSQLVALQMLVRGLPPDDSEKRSRYFAELALRQAHQLERLTNDLLDVGRLRSGRLRLRLSSLDLVPLVTKTMEALRLTLNDTDPQLALTVRPAAVPLVINGDVTRMEQVITNLVTNALKYAPTSERIEVTLEVIERTGDSAAKREIVLQVRDAGRGIPAADLPHLFTRFYQVQRTDVGDPTGLGLGLYITRELVVAQGGTIDVASELGRGTTFTLRFPLLDEREGAITPV